MTDSQPKQQVHEQHLTFGPSSNGQGDMLRSVSIWGPALALQPILCVSSFHCGGLLPADNYSAVSVSTQTSIWPLEPPSNWRCCPYLMAAAMERPNSAALSLPSSTSSWLCFLASQGPI